MQKIALILFPLLLSVSLHAQTESDTIRNAKFAAIPMVNYSNTTGFSLGAMAQMYYKVNLQDTISPTSSTGVIGMYTTNGTYFMGAFQRFYLQEDNWRIMLGGGTGNINFQYWQNFPIIGGSFIGFSTKANFAMAKIERRVYDKLYGGIQGTYIYAETEYDLPEIIPDTFRYDRRNMNNLAYLFNYDKREHQMNPYSGYNISFQSNFYRTWLNSGNNFGSYEFVYNHYYQIKNEKNILVTRIKAAIAYGDVPFQGENVVGQDDIRGYSSGKYRDKHVYTVQAEYRWRFYKNFGLVGFFGLAAAVPKVNDLFSSEILPGIGAGFRYMMIPSERINIGFDIAKGLDDWGLYFRIGEAFTR